MKKICNKCRYKYPQRRDTKYYKCYSGDCPAKKRDNENAVAKKYIEMYRKKSKLKGRTNGN